MYQNYHNARSLLLDIERLERDFLWYEIKLVLWSTDIISVLKGRASLRCCTSCLRMRFDTLWLSSYRNNYVLFSRCYYQSHVSLNDRIQRNRDGTLSYIWLIPSRKAIGAISIQQCHWDLYIDPNLSGIGIAALDTEWMQRTLFWLHSSDL